MEEGVDLLVVYVRGNLLYFLVDMAVGDEQIQPAIVVVIEKASAKAQHVSRGQRNACGVAHFVEQALTVVMPKVVGGKLEIGNIEVQTAIVVVIAQGNTHGGHGASTGRERHAGRGRGFPECSVLLVVVEINFQAVIGDKQVGPAITIVVGGSNR